MSDDIVYDQAMGLTIEQIAQGADMDIDDVKKLLQQLWYKIISDSTKIKFRARTLAGPEAFLINQLTNFINQNNA